MKRYAIGTDIGGSHITCAVVDMKNHSILPDTLSHQKLNNQDSKQVILDAWSQSLRASLSKVDRHEFAGIGFAMPGPFDYENGIALFTHDVSKYENLYGMNVAKEIKELLGIDSGCDIRFMNDATSFAVGEAWACGFNRQHLISITLGTGFGSAFIENGFPVVTRSDVPEYGCLWHLPFKDGIADDYFSTRWYVRRYEELRGERLPGVKEIAERIGQDVMANSLFEEFGGNLGEFLAPWIKKFAAGDIVIGGNISKVWNLFERPFRETMEGLNVNASIHISELGEMAAIIGSARLLDNLFWDRVKPLLSKM